MLKIMKKSELRQFIKESISEIMSEAPMNPQNQAPNPGGPYPGNWDGEMWGSDWLTSTITPFFGQGNPAGACNFTQNRISMWQTKMADMGSGILFDNQLAYKIGLGQSLLDYLNSEGFCQMGPGANLEEQRRGKISLPSSFIKFLQDYKAKRQGKPAMGKPALSRPAMGRPAMGKPKAIRPAAGKPRM